MSRPSLRLAGKVALVTGAGTAGAVTGTGQAIAVLFAREGARVLLVDRDERHARRTLETIEKEGGEALVFAADVAQDADCHAMVKAAETCYGALHILINNVGISRTGTAVTVKETDWDEVLAVDLKSMVLAARHAIPAMIRAGGGAIVNISSIDGMRAGWVPNLPYAAAKGGAIALTTSMAVHHGRDRIRVNAIAPGFLYASLTSGVSEAHRDLRRRATALGIEGDASDVAYAALFLASDESRWITGVTLPVDGGSLAANPLSLLERDADGLFPKTSPLDFLP
ncbi:MAG: SDR family oxidoreductase [candidate division Zixibacteria bacterium]|nr:SDR family oxidoreductase [candidate division Zixibacteria bacterium]